MFEIGQRVVCIQQDVNKKLTVDCIYIVKDIVVCCREVIDVGKYTTNGLDCVCSDCGYDNVGKGGAKFFLSEYFAPIEDMEEATEAVNKLIKEINEPVLL